MRDDLPMLHGGERLEISIDQDQTGGVYEASQNQDDAGASPFEGMVDDVYASDAVVESRIQEVSENQDKRSGPEAQADPARAINGMR